MLRYRNVQSHSERLLYEAVKKQEAVATAHITYATHGKLRKEAFRSGSEPQRKYTRVKCNALSVNPLRCGLYAYQILYIVCFVICCIIISKKVSYMSREVRRTQPEDLIAIFDIYTHARAFMAENGNPTQWGDSSPSAEIVKADAEENGYVVVEDDNVIGVFYFEENAHEPAYDSILGAWINEQPYAVVHRCAVKENSMGVGQFILDWCYSRFNNIRIDTHEDNTPMKNLLGKNGYKYCGKVMYNKKNGERIAYQKCAR